MQMDAPNPNNTPQRKELIDRAMLKRLGSVEDMAAVAAFLASDDASFITAETIVVAGGTQSRL
jgi:dehydrogenase/reductase SDR family protein 4